MLKRFHRIQIIFFTLLSYIILNAQNNNYDLSIEKILALPENEIDLGIACLSITKEICPDVDIDYFVKQLEIMAQKISYISQGTTEPEARIGAMNTFLYRAGWWNDSLTFTYDLDDLDANKISNQFLSGYLNTRLGSCITMPMLHLVLADKLGWPIKAVRSPKHIFCRYIDRNFEMNNIEATCGGGYISNERYISDSQIPEKPIKNGVYLRTLSKKEYIASMLLTCARYCSENNSNIQKAIYYSGLAVYHDSTLSGGHWNLGKYYNILAFNIETEMIERKKEIEEQYSNDFIVLRNQAQINDFAPEVPSPWDYQNKRKEEQQQRMMQPSNPFKIPMTTLDPCIPQAQQAGRAPQPINQNAVDPKSRIRINELQLDKNAKIEAVEKKYIPIIKEALARSEWHKNKAKELGIVLELPTEFFIKQSESIEKFKETGEY